MITALITLYNPSKENLKNINIISKQVNRVLLWDNSNSKTNTLIQTEENVYYLKEGKNLGLSKAFNTLLKNSQFGWEDDEFIIFFDQDSIVNENHVKNLIKIYKIIKNDDINIGCIGPGIFNKNSNTLELPKRKKQIIEGCYKVQSLITSSLLTTYSNLKDINFWNDNIFLDLADQDLCYRFKQANKHCYLTTNVVLNHAIGETSKKILCFHIRVSQPFREYYQLRDCLNIVSENYIPLDKKTRYLLRVIFRPIIHLLFLDHKKERLKFIKRGYIDFKKNYHGELL